jgi:hypothetical protein
MLPPGFMLRMGENGALKMIANRLIDTRVELQAGSSVVEVDQVKADYNVGIALKDGMVNLSKVGVYRFDSDPARLKVFHGTATVEIGGQSVIVPAGKMLALVGGLANAEKFDVGVTDALDNWSRRQAEAMAVANVSGAKYSGGSNYPSTGGSTWAYNPYYDMYTYVPMSGTMCNPFYGLCYYSPSSAYQTFYVMPRLFGYVPSVGGYHGSVTGTSTSALGSSTAGSPTRSLGAGSSTAGSGGSFGSAAGSLGSGSGGGTAGLGGHGTGFGGGGHGGK